jgi:DNA repair exonuclease SbcCD ATPase subunit
MALKIKDITVRNFMSVGNVTQAVNFDRNDLTLVLGENLDLGGDDTGARNGTGKTTIINALSFALYGNALTNIKKDNLINKTNGKNMMVTIDFEKDGIDYRIERGRKPAVMKFFVSGNEKEITDEAQGDSRETQAEIERMLGLSHDMFKHILALNTYTEPFLSLKANDQRTIIEQLLGITTLSEKAEALKELIKLTKDSITKEEFRIKAVTDANKRIEDQIETIIKRQQQWQTKHDADLSLLVETYDELNKIDIEAEITAHKDLSVWLEGKKQQDARASLVLKQTAWKNKHDQDLNQLAADYDRLSQVDISVELQSHKDLAIYTEQSRNKIDYDSKLRRAKADLEKEKKIWETLDTEVQSLKEHKCYACGSELHDAAHEETLSKKLESLNNSVNAMDALLSEIATLEANPIFVGTKPTTIYRTEAEAIRHSSDLENILQKIETKNSEVDPYGEQLSAYPLIDIGVKPTTVYRTEQEAFEHKSNMAAILSQLVSKQEETDPYTEQVNEMKTNGIEDIDYDVINALMTNKEHQEFLLKLLTNKDSFIRKRIIDQNLSYLNSRLGHYLDNIGLPHLVKFNNDLTVSITELGRDLDFDNLSRGERNRLILSLSWAFRDVWESLYQPINLLFIDELVDSGMDSSGVENALGILKKMGREHNRSIWLVSHKDELAGRVNNTMRVIKENGYTTYNTDVDVA